MIDPRSFISPGQDNNEENFVEISGTFFCEKCNYSSGSARLDLDTNSILWNCACGENESSL